MAVSILKQVMEEKLDANNVEVASVTKPPASEPVPVTAACHYVPRMVLGSGCSLCDDCRCAPNAFRGLLRLFQFRTPSEARVAAPDSRLPRMAAMEWGRLPQNAAVGRTLLGRAVQIHFLGSGMCRSACLTVLW